MQSADKVTFFRKMGYSMATKQELLLLLRQQKDFTPSAVLANKLNISIRTLRTMVSDINQGQTVILSSRKGYKLDSSAEETVFSSIPETPEERQSWLERQIIYSSSPQELDSLANELYVSDSTLKNDLAKVQKSFARQNLRLSFQKGAVSCSGSELDKRRYINTLLRRENQTLFTNYQVIQDMFPELEVSSIESLIQNEFFSHHVLINGYSLLNMTLHLCICIRRIRSGCVISDNFSEAQPAVMPVVLEIAASLQKALKSGFDAELNQAEFYELAGLIQNYMPLGQPAQPSAQTPELIDCQRLADEIMEAINKEYYIDLSASPFKSRFVYHLQNLLMRVKTNSTAKNELSFEFKKSYPLIYDISVYAASIIQRWTHCALSDDEIAYIALHIGCSAQRNQPDEGYIRASLLCPSYYDFQDQLLAKINDLFPGKLKVSQLILSDLEIPTLWDTDFLISTYPIRVVELPVVYISPFLTDSDQEKLRSMADQLQAKKRASFFKAYISCLFSPSLFLANPPCSDPSQVIRHLAGLMNKAGVTESGYEDQVLYRESLSSTAFGGFAMPHTLNMDANISRIAVAIFKKAIPWGEHHVNIVFMIALNQNDRNKFSEIFSTLTDSLFDDECVERLSKVANYEEMLDLLVEFIR